MLNGRELSDDEFRTLQAKVSVLRRDLQHPSFVILERNMRTERWNDDFWSSQIQANEAITEVQGVLDYVVDGEHLFSDEDEKKVSELLGRAKDLMDEMEASIALDKDEDRDDPPDDFGVIGPTDE